MLSWSEVQAVGDWATLLVERKSRVMTMSLFIPLLSLWREAYLGTSASSLTSGRRSCLGIFQHPLSTHR